MKLIEPINSAGTRGAMKQAIEEHKSMFEARRRGNAFGRYVNIVLRKAIEEERANQQETQT